MLVNKPLCDDWGLVFLSLQLTVSLGGDVLGSYRPSMVSGGGGGGSRGLGMFSIIIIFTGFRGLGILGIFEGFTGFSMSRGLDSPGTGAGIGTGLDLNGADGFRDDWLWL